MPYGVPHFNLERFPAREARVDRLDVSFDLGSIRATRQQVTHFAQRVPLSLHDDDGQVCGLLNRPQRPPRQNRWIWKIAKRVGPAQRRPLFGGNITLARSLVEPETGTEIWVFACNLALNPTRWLHYQPISCSDGTSHTLLLEAVDLFSRDVDDSNEQVLVEDADNVIVGSNARMDMASPDRWPVQLRRYLMGVIDLFQTWLAQSVERQPLALVQQAPRQFTLNSLEIYWEQGQSSPVELLHHWEPALRRYAAQSTTSYRRAAFGTNSPAPRIDDVLLGRSGSSPCFSMPVARGADFKVYAKTNQRLRFEVTYHTRRASRIFPRITAATIEELCAFIDAGAADAQQRVQRIARTFSGQTLRPFAPPPREPYQLILEIAFRLRDEAIARRIAADLVLHGGVQSASDPLMRNAIRVLKRAGILKAGERAGRHYIHRITEPYRLGLAALQQSRSLLHVRRPLDGDLPRPLDLPSYLPEGMTVGAWRVRRFRQSPGPYVPDQQSQRGMLDE